MNNKLILIFFVCLLFGCKSDDAFDSANADASSGIVPSDELPIWLSEQIDLLIEDYVKHPISMPSIVQASVYRGEWKKQPVYLVQSMHSSCMFCFVDKDGKPISYSPPTVISLNDKLENVLPESKNWNLILQIVDGKIVGGVGTRSSLSDVSYRK